MRAKHERDLYLAILNVGVDGEIEAFLGEALRSILAATRARRGYLELSGDAEQDDVPTWWIAHGFDECGVAGVRRAISRGVIAEAIATGETIVTPSAVLDPRFEGRESVQRERIDAVLCAPIGTDPPRGVLYLQGWTDPDAVSDDDRVLAENFCKHVAPLVERLRNRTLQKDASDPTAPIRQRLRLDGVIGRSQALATVLKQVSLVVPLDVNVLLTGDSGTGKSQLGRVIHDNGPRAGQPFVEINCAALPEALIESELFGALPGAHSTAIRRIEGKVQAASRGTLFLDEIGELPLQSQAKLLQLIQSKQYFPLGATKAATADVRVIAATNTDLERAVAAKRFREDLFYRLQVVPIRVPTLDERREDIPALAAYFCADACRRHALRVLRISPAARRAVCAAPWPGNIRQLAHAIEAAAIRAAGEGVSEIEPRHVFATPVPDAGENAKASFQERTRRFQARIVRETLEDCDWNVTEVARRLDLTRAHVYNLIRAFGIVREPGR